MLLGARDEEGAGLTDVELRDELMTLLVAGHETTATALAWAWERLLRRPAVLERLEREVAAGEDAYLDAVVKETLRLRPVIMLVARRMTRPLTVAGLDLPAGTVVAPCIYLAHRRPEVYPEPAEFRPERFLESTPDAYSWIPFGGGIRRCIGAAFAQYEMKVVLRTMVARAQSAGSAPGLRAPPAPQRDDRPVRGRDGRARRSGAARRVRSRSPKRRRRAPRLCDDAHGRPRPCPPHSTASVTRARFAMEATGRLTARPLRPGRPSRRLARLAGTSDIGGPQCSARRINSPWSEPPECWSRPPQPPSPTRSSLSHPARSRRTGSGSSPRSGPSPSRRCGSRGCARPPSPVRASACTAATARSTDAPSAATSTRGATSCATACARRAGSARPRVARSGPPRPTCAAWSAPAASTPRRRRRLHGLGPAPGDRRLRVRREPERGGRRRSVPRQVPVRPRDLGFGRRHG